MLTTLLFSPFIFLPSVVDKYRNLQDNNEECIRSIFLVIFQLSEIRYVGTIIVSARKKDNELSYLQQIGMFVTNTRVVLGKQVRHKLKDKLTISYIPRNSNFLLNQIP